MHALEVTVGDELTDPKPTTPNGTVYAVIYNPTEDFSENVTIKTGAVPTGATTVVGYFDQQTGIHTIHGSLSTNISTVNSNAQARGIRLDNGASLTVLGDTNLSSESSTTLALGLGIYNTSNHLDLHAGLATLNISSGTGRIMGMDIEGKSTLELADAVINMNASGAVSNGKTRWIQGLYSAQGTTHASGSVTFNVTSHNAEGQLVDAGTNTAIRVINLEGSAYSTYARIDGNVDINLHTMAHDAYGVYVSGDMASDENLHAGLSVGGTLSVKIEGRNNEVRALYAQGESGIEADRAVITIHSDAASGQADTSTNITGVHAQANPTFYPGPGRIVLTNGLEETISGSGTIIGIESRGAYQGRNSTIMIGGTTTLDLRSTDNSATGLRVTDGAEASLVNVSATVAAKTDAVGIDVNDGELTLAGTNHLTVTGETSAVGIRAESGSTIKLSGTAAVTAPTALTLSEGSEIMVDNTADERSSSLLLDGGVQNNGQISLRKAALEIVGDKDGSYDLGLITATNGSDVEVGAGQYQIDRFEGDDTKTLRLNDLEANVTLSNVTDKVQIAASGEANDRTSNAEAAAEALTKAVTFGNTADRQGQTIIVEEGLVNDALTAVLNENGNLQEVSIRKNEKVETLSAVTSLSLLSWRHETNDLTQRMGELRDMPEGAGAWVRLFGSEQAYGRTDVEQKNASIQLGGDVDVGAGWKLGGAFTYTDSTSTYALGEADGDAYTFGLYGTWLGDAGCFLDLSLKYGRLSNDFDVDALHGDVDNNAVALSVDYGRRFAFTELAFVEPQLGLTYSRVFGDDFGAGAGVRIHQDDFESIVGRIGVRTGFLFPEKKGAVFARFTVLNDFSGDFDATVTNGTAHNTMHGDLGGTWVEYGMGGSYRFGERTQAYVDLERSSGGDIDTHWRWNVGVRHAF